MKMPRLKVPRLRDIKSKLGAAKLLGLVVKNSLTFKIKRSALRRFRHAEFDTIIVDMDGTLYKTDANLEALALAYPEKTESGKASGEEIYDSVISKIASGEYSIEKAIVEGNKFLMGRKISRPHLFHVLDRIKPTLRRQLINALIDIKASGKTIVLATLSSKDFGNMLNEHLRLKYGFEFDCIIGTELRFNEAGAITGIKSMVGTKDFEFEGIAVRTKLTAIKEGLAAQGKNLDVKKSVIITDSYADIDIAKMLVTILLRPSSPTTAQKISYRLGLADYILPDNKDLKVNLESIILGAEKEEGAETQKEEK